MYHLQVPLDKLEVEKFQEGGVEIFSGGVAVRFFRGELRFFREGLIEIFFWGGLRNFRGVEKL